MDFRNNFSILIVDDETNLLENLYNFLKKRVLIRFIPPKTSKNLGLSLQISKLT